MKPRFLLDENMSLHFRASIHSRLPQLDILRVGDPGAPPLRTPDEVILAYVESAGRILVTKNRASMPDHLQALFARDGKHWGILTVRQGATYREVFEALELINATTEAEDWINVMTWIPF